MADVTVKQLAQVVGISPEHLLTQLQKAGIAISNENDTINEQEKLTLLSHLKSGVSKDPVAKGQITLRRKSVSQVPSHDMGSGKTVNIEVRKKRVFVKRPVETPPLEEPEDLESVVEDESPDSVIAELESTSAAESPTVLDSEECSQSADVISEDVKNGTGKK